MKKSRRVCGMLLLCICMLLISAVSVFAAGPKKIAAIGIPAGVQAAGKDYQTIEVSWKKVSGVSGYHVYRSTTKNGYYKKCASIKGVDKTSVEIKESLLRQKYYFKVQTFKGKEKSAFSKPVAAQAVETVPTLLSVTRQGSTSFTLTWSEAPGAHTYVIFQKKGSGKYEKLQTVSLNKTSADIKGLAPNTSYRFLVRAIYRVGSKYYWGTASNSKAGKTGKARIPATRYRALLIGNQYRQNYKSNNGPAKHDIDAMQYLLRGAEKNPYSVVKRSDQSKSQILSLIKSTFRNATENDISLFYFSGKAAAPAGSYAGALYTGNSESLTLAELAKALGEIPGKVAVILDSDCSGAAIEEIGDFPQMKGSQASSWNQKALSAFAAEDARHRGTVQPKFGEFRQNKFVVLTAANSFTKVNWGWDSNDVPYGSVFTMDLLESAGCRYPYLPDNIVISPNSFNKDNCLTYGEAFQWVEAQYKAMELLNPGYEFKTMIYPSKDCDVPFIIR